MSEMPTSEVRVVVEGVEEAVQRMEARILDFQKIKVVLQTLTIAVVVMSMYNTIIVFFLDWGRPNATDIALSVAFLLFFNFWISSFRNKKLDKQSNKKEK